MGCGGQVVTHMVEIHKITAILTKLFFHLRSNPFRSIPDGVQMGFTTKTRPRCTIKEVLSCLPYITLPRPTVDWARTALGMRKTNPGFCPEQPCMDSSSFASTLFDIAKGRLPTCIRSLS